MFRETEALHVLADSASYQIDGQKHDTRVRPRDRSMTLRETEAPIRPTLQSRERERDRERETERESQGYPKLHKSKHGTSRKLRQAEGLLKMLSHRLVLFLIQLLILLLHHFLLHESLRAERDRSMTLRETEA